MHAAQPRFPSDRKFARRCNRTVADVFTRSFAACAQIVEPAEDDRFGRANFRARRHESALLPVVTKGALECAARIGQRLRAAIDHAERTGNDAITAAVANIVLHEDGADFRAHDRSGRTGFETAGFFAMFANVGEKNPAKRISPFVGLTTSGRRSDFLFVDPARGT